eukprot:177663-Amphidinium_carterae.2
MNGSKPVLHCSCNAVPHIPPNKMSRQGRDFEVRSHSGPMWSRAHNQFPPKSQHSPGVLVNTRQALGCP